MHKTNTESLSQEPAAVPVDFEGLATRLLARDTSNRGSLLSAFREGPSEFEDTLDDLAFVAAMLLPEYADGAARLKGGHLKESEAEELAAHQRELFSEIRHALILESGVPVAETLSDIDKARLAVVERLKALKSGSTENDYLRALGVLKENSKHGTTFIYPEDLFPESMNEKWHIYIGTVSGHLDAELKLRNREIDQADFENADRVRQLAHDSIAGDIHKALGFSLIEGSDWTYQDTRRLVAKMRDRKFVGQDTSEAAVANRALEGATQKIGVLAVGLLAQKSSKR